MFANGRAYTVHFSKEIRLQTEKTSGYLPSGEVVLCPISEGQCPYKNEKIRGYFADDDLSSGEICICGSDGLVEKAGLLKIEEPKNKKRKFRVF